MVGKLCCAFSLNHLQNRPKTQIALNLSRIKWKTDRFIQFVSALAPSPHRPHRPSKSAVNGVLHYHLMMKLFIIINLNAQETRLMDRITCVFQFNLNIFHPIFLFVAFSCFTVYLPAPGAASEKKRTRIIDKLSHTLSIPSKCFLMSFSVSAHKNAFKSIFKLLNRNVFIWLGGFSFLGYA